MTENTNNPDVSGELADHELQQVSGGQLPENILTYCDLLEPEKRKSMERVLARSGEEVFLMDLIKALKLNGHSDAAYEVHRYYHGTWLPCHY